MWSGTTGTMDKVVKNNIPTPFLKIRRHNTAIYTILYLAILTTTTTPESLLFAGNSTSVMAAIGDLKEEAGPSFNQHSATWVGCSHAVLSETHLNSKLYMETNDLHYT